MENHVQRHRILLIGVCFVIAVVASSSHVFTRAWQDGRLPVEKTTDSNPKTLDASLLNPREVTLITASQFRQILDHHKGKVVLVNLWATWCIPCIREMPDLSKLQTDFGDKGLKVIGISLDEAEDLHTRVKPFFEKRSVSFVSYLQSEPDPQQVVGVLDENWEGVLPTTYLIDRSGKVKQKLIGSKSYDQFAAVITPLLEAK
jgi:thiol-disulfide isomerase/thioredoxin